MTTTTLISIDADFDDNHINEVFNFTYNLSVFRNLIESIVKANKSGMSKFEVALHNISSNLDLKVSGVEIVLNTQETLANSRDKIYNKYIEGLKSDVTQLSEDLERMNNQNNQRFTLLENLLLKSDMIKEEDKMDLNNLRQNIIAQQEEDAMRKTKYLEDKLKNELELEKEKEEQKRIMENEVMEKERMLRKHNEEEQKFQKKVEDNKKKIDQRFSPKPIRKDHMNTLGDNIITEERGQEEGGKDNEKQEEQHGKDGKDHKKKKSPKKSPKKIIKEAQLDENGEVLKDEDGNILYKDNIVNDIEGDMNLRDEERDRERTHSRGNTASKDGSEGNNYNDEDEGENVDTDDQNRSLKKKIGELEDKLFQLNNILFEKLEGQERLNDRLQEKLDKIDDQSRAMNSELENMRIKVMDFNIYDAFKNQTDENGNPKAFDPQILLIENLDKKVMAKFGKVDIHVKNLEDSSKKYDINIFKLQDKSLKFENALKKIGEGLSKGGAGDFKFDFGNDDEEPLYARMEDVRKYVDKKINEAFAGGEDEDGSEMKDMVLNTNGSKDDKVADQVDKTLTTNVPGGKFDSPNSTMKKNNNKIFGSIDYLKQEILKLNEELKDKVTSQDFSTHKSIQEKHIISINSQITQITEDLLLLDIVKHLKKKVESVISTLQNLKLLENIATDDKNGGAADEVISGFVTKAEFKDSEKKFTKMLEVKGDKIDENKRLIEEIINLLKYKISEREIKLLEEFLLGKIEDVKIGCKKKYAVKFDTEKSIKMIETQVKYIIDSYLKKEKGENWLLAKKPMNGFECASCESYIGDLSTRGNQHISYKYPMRDPSDAAYRCGNGYSRMLQILNLDKDDDRVSIEKNVMLPKINQSSNNLSADYVHTEDKEENKGDAKDVFNPKIVKVYKKNMRVASTSDVRTIKNNIVTP